ncbi:hypothetical protein [Saccharothrix sp. 6-C]|uniref:hypothetical protein n=1 Tax=Saccharothrix sp. 6-C TaxID=2781735 RepID=UPI001F43D459|nr:hypothetical protein [Saccharothrix sp. 6-C]
MVGFGGVAHPQVHGLAQGEQLVLLGLAERGQALGRVGGGEAAVLERGDDVGVPGEQVGVELGEVADRALGADAVQQRHRVGQRFGREQVVGPDGNG